MKRNINIGKKTIQVSNFHNPAETDVNLTGRKQILIKRAVVCFFMEKQRNIFGNNFKPYKVRFNFLKKGKRVFSFEKENERNKIFCRSVFRKRKGFLFCAQPNGKNRHILFTEKL